MKPAQAISNPREPKDRIEGNKIILDAAGYFPRPVIFAFPLGRVEEYRIVKTKNNRFQLEK